jgi:hypothetical protein
VILAFLAASGLIIGIFFKSLALVVSCLLVAFAILVSAIKAGGRRGAAVRTREQPDYPVSVVLKALDGAGRKGLDGSQGFESEAAEAENVPRSVVGTFRVAARAEDRVFVSVHDLYPPRIEMDNSTPNADKGIGLP